MGTKLKEIRPGERIVLDNLPGRVYTLQAQTHGFALVVGDGPEAKSEAINHNQSNGEPILAHGEVVYTSEVVCAVCGA